MILRIEMILFVVSYDRKNIIFYEINLKHTETNTFEIEFFLTSYKILKNHWIFINHGLFYRGRYSLQLYCFQFYKYIFQWLKPLKENFLKIVIFEDFILYFKNSRQ